MDADIKLAIVIPAYKSEYLADALLSISNQTDKRFRVYVGDDASPGPIREICERFQDKLDLVYHRFSENLGGSSLIDQWHRCIELSSEPWVWIFSDDDKMDPGCVEAFYSSLEATEAGYDLCRFNTLDIDENGKVIRISPPHPSLESGLEFAYHRLCRNRSSFVSEYIFSRIVFDEHDGMVKFPLAWCADDASWIAFSGEKGIYTIYGPKVYWRNSRINISFARTANKLQKVEACGQFLFWLKQKFTPGEIRKQLGIDAQYFRDCCADWLKFHLIIQAPLGPGIYLKIFRDEKFSDLGSPAKRLLTAIFLDIVYIFRLAPKCLSSLSKKFVRFRQDT